MRTAASKRFESLKLLDKLSKSQSSGLRVEVTDMETNTFTTYHAIRAAARALAILGLSLNLCHLSYFPFIFIYKL